MSYTKLESNLNAIDRKVKRFNDDNDVDGIIDLAWRLGYKGEQFFSPYAQDLISEMGLYTLAESAYRDGLADLNY